MTTGVHANEDLLFSVLIQLIIMIGAARALNIVARRLGQPKEVAALAAFLLSDEAAYITRQVISVNGGMV